MNIIHGFSCLGISHYLPRKELTMNLCDIKNWCIAIRPKSSGDLLRMMHGINVKFKPEPPKTTHVAIICDNKTKDLMIDACVKESSLELSWVCLPSLKGPKNGSEYTAEDIVNAWKKHFPNDDFCFGAKCIWTSFSNGRSGQFKKYLSNNEIKIQRLDCADHNKDFPSSLIRTTIEPKTNYNTPLKVAVVLREAGIAQWRNSPYYYYCDNFWASLGLDITYVGLASQSDYKPHQQNISKGYSGKNLQTQLINAKEFDLAIGVNSSALDVYAAAGCFIIREVVFQGHSKRWSFGWDYNKFLGLSPNLELRIAKNLHESIQWNDELRLKQTILTVVEFMKTKQRNFSSNVSLLKGFPGFSRSINSATDDRTQEQESIKNWLTNSTSLNG